MTLLGVLEKNERLDKKLDAFLTISNIQINC